jgi:CRP/FNR family transcriptional regulator
MAKGADCASCAIRHSGFCGLLDDQTQSTVAGCKRILTLPANKLLWEGEQGLGFIGILQSGYLRFQRYGIDGRRQILFVLQPGDIIGDPQDQARGYSVETATLVRICKFDEHRFDRLMQDVPEVARAVYRMRSARLDELRWLTWSLGMLSAEERFCAFLATAATFMPFEPDGQRGGMLTIQLPRRDIADLLATSVETISRNCQKLALEGVIDIVGPATFRIPDLQRLVERGCLTDAGGSVHFVRNYISRSVEAVLQDRTAQFG